MTIEMIREEIERQMSEYSKCGMVVTAYALRCLLDFIGREEN